MHKTTVTLTADPWKHPQVFAAAFNSGDPDQVEQVYEVDGILVAEPGSSVTGLSRRTANAKLMSLGVPIEVMPRHVYVNGDLAILIVDWRLQGIGADGVQVDLNGTATDVARRGADGRWRYVIDNPWGTATGARGAVD